MAGAILSLELQNVDLTINNQVYLKDINLCFVSGAFNVLLGRTLAGKTSLMRVIAGLDKLTSGKVLLNGEDITQRTIQKRNVSMVYQQFINYPHFTVWENIASPLKLAKVSAPEINRRVHEIAELLHIGPYLQRQPLALSGGQQQRCAMARALVKDSQLILFDEPLVNLDYKLRETLRFELKALFKQRNSIAIYATTEAHEALALGGSTTLLHEGRVIQSGEALQQYYRPANLNAANLYHEPPMNQFDMLASSHKLEVAGQDVLPKSKRLADLAHGTYRCAIRPDQVYLASSHSPEMCIHAQVDLAEISASETYLHVSVQDPSLHNRNWVVHMRGIHHFSHDQSVKLYIAIQDIYVFDQNGIAVSWPAQASSRLHVSTKKAQVN
ncbi:MAG: glycerol transport system ATP-binding protein [Alphaproteobacteria bacterium]